MRGQHRNPTSRRRDGLTFPTTTVTALILLLAAAAAGPGAAATEAEEAALPAGVSGDWLAGAQQEVAEAEYHLTWQQQTRLEDLPSAWHAPNRAHDFRIYFTERGIRVVRRSEEHPGWEWSLALIGYGRGKETLEVEGAVLAPRENRIEYRRGDLTEWYLNSPAGLKQGFTLAIPPELPGAEGLVHLELELGGTLDPRFAEDGGAIDFVSVEGAPLVRYSGLLVEDAAGTPLPAWLEGFSREGLRGIRLVIDDHDALYPLLVDPLATSPSWTAEANQSYALMGYGVSTAGDVNGDGYSDVVVSATSFDNGHTDEGRVFAYYGSASGLPTVASWTAEGEQPGAHFGRSLSTAGDVNGDGYSDIIVGAPYYDNPETSEGGAFVFHGSATGLNRNGDRPSGTPANADWRTYGEQIDAFLGNSVGPAGDVNGDGYGEVLVGAQGYDNGQVDEGRVYVHYGSSTGPAYFASWYAEGDSVNANLGRSVDTAGDVNGDGYSDIIIGAPRWEDGQAAEGAAFVFHGSSGGLELGGSRWVGRPSNADWHAEGNSATAHLGGSVSTAGNVNGDGYADVLIGAEYYDNGQTDEGAAFVFHGSSSGLNAGGSRPIGIPTNANWRAESNQAGARFGSAVGTAGDTNGDDYADVVVGAVTYDTDGGTYTDGGRAYVFEGGASGLSSGAELVWEVHQINALFGLPVGSAGDVNGDGFADVIVGAFGQDNGQVDEGMAYVYHGSPRGLSPTSGWSRAGGDVAAWNLGRTVATAGDVNGNGLADIIVGAGESFHVWLGSSVGLPSSGGDVGHHEVAHSVATAGDLNGDGYMDIVVGDENHDGARGRVFVYFGYSGGISSSPDWTLLGRAGGVRFGHSVASGGDINGDGISDLVVGAYRDYDGASQEGCIQVYHGRVSGVPSSYNRRFCGDYAGGWVGYSVASAGDVNGDGYSDVIAGAPYGRGDGSGEAIILFGSLTGLRTEAPEEIHSSGCRNDPRYGWSVASAGDVNGDGYSDVVVGSPGCDIAGYNDDRGAAFVYHGSSSGSFLSYDWMVRGVVDDDLYGHAVAGAGDLNGDGRSEIIVGRGRTIGTAPGRAYVYYGSDSGLGSSALVLDGHGSDDEFGFAVGAAGDVNGDGYGDVIVGAENYDSGDGGVYVYYGGGGKGLSVKPLQYRKDNSAFISPLGASDWEDRFRLALRGRTPFGRSYVRMRMEIKPRGTVFNGGGTQATSWWNTGTTYAGINYLKTGLTKDTQYHWRVRAEYHPARTPYGIHGRWLTRPWNGWNETDLRMPGCRDSDGDGYGLPASAWCSSTAEDCDDGNGAIHPGASEGCDGIDTNCDGWTPPSEIDNDGDTYAECEGDCDDGQSAMFPGNPEICDNLDNDCSGGVDGFATSCGLGECAASGVCVAGVDSCTPGDPVAEICDGLDNDCNGSVPSEEADSDGDGRRICHGDCNDNSDLVWGKPSAIRNLRFGPDPGTIFWDSPLDPGGETSALHYDTLRSTDCEDLSAAVCVETDDGPNREAHDPDEPSPGEAFFYLVRSGNDCPGSGPLGDGSGAPRSGPECPGCAHDRCSEGSVLDPACDECVWLICNVDSYCCNTEWDDVCVDEVSSICGESCS